ncbi:aldehyde dehydrogenase family protein [Natrinema gelatinilyticum]|uniref:aldehyde dehydrogenase family protein n=1 Tax=Natrinema gelatinilyticum TaxID=2961571 RepID=UPI0020C38D8F|nr:aldehyde dehydrogenase family protein [Natrinema gelatinilyticum]
MGYSHPATSRDRELQLYIGGKWRESESGAVRTATDPATDEPIATYPDGTREDTHAAVDAARSAQPVLERMSAFKRAELCHEIADAIDDQFETLVEWLIADQGKPIASAEYEVNGTSQLFRIAAEDVKRDEPPTIQSSNRNKRVYTMRKPHGVVGIVTPWNFPLSIPAEYIGPGLAAGNALVWVPAPTTSVVAVTLAEVLAETSLPDGALNLVTGEGPVVGDEVVSYDDVDAVGFTGSPETGEAIARAAGAKPTLLEMGGNGPVIVLEDADVKAAAEAATGGCYTNAGQVCGATGRILVHESIHDEFVERVVAQTDEMVVGDPWDEATDMGPLNNDGVAEKMDRHVRDAEERGATVLQGGGRVADAPTDRYYEPTVIDDVTPAMALNREESFGPVAPVLTFSDDDEAIELANDIDLGLISGVFTASLARADRFVDEVQTGIVNVNGGSTYWEKHIPFGGHSGKKSGIGRLGGRHTLEELSQLKTAIVDPGADPS